MKVCYTGVYASLPAQRDSVGIWWLTVGELPRCPRRGSSWIRPGDRVGRRPRLPPQPRVRYGACFGPRLGAGGQRGAPLGDRPGTVLRMPSPWFAISATVAQAPAHDRLDVLDAVVAVDDDGTIAAMEPAGSAGAESLLASAPTVVRATPDELLLPGLIDLHVHAPQWPQLGTGLDLPLDQWLLEHTFPLEARYVDLGFARSVWDDMVPRLLAYGTTTAVYFGTVDVGATSLLAETCARHGQRAWVGRVAMDHPGGTPTWYRDPDAGAGVASSARSIDEIHAIDGGHGLVRPIVTPRFTPACTDEMLTGLAALAERTGTLVQTHCAESDWVRGAAIERFGLSDTAALHRHGLLRPGTVLAHGNHVGDDDADLIALTASGIAHCPLSNAYFANAVLPVRRLLDRGVRIGLGTDVAGGASPSLLRQCHEAVTASRLLEDGVDTRLPAGE